MKKNKYWFLDLVAESSPEDAAIASELKRDYKAGKIKQSPRTYLGCRNWEDAWLYAFSSARLAPADFIKKTADKITLVALVGVGFNDQVVAALTKIAKRIGPNPDLLELRLFRTKITHRGSQQLQAIFPAAKIRTFSEQQEVENSKLKWVNRTDIQ